jgi:hypothetical protein
MSRGTPRRMKMTSRYPATKQQDRLPPRGLVVRSFLLGAARLSRSWTPISAPEIFNGVSEILSDR